MFWIGKPNRRKKLATVRLVLVQSCNKRLIRQCSSAFSGQPVHCIECHGTPASPPVNNAKRVLDHVLYLGFPVKSHAGGERPGHAKRGEVTPGNLDGFPPVERVWKFLNNVGLMDQGQFLLLHVPGCPAVAIH